MYYIILISTKNIFYNQPNKISKMMKNLDSVAIIYSLKPVKLLFVNQNGWISTISYGSFCYN